MERSEFSREEQPRTEVHWTDHGDSWEYRVEIQGVGQIVCDVMRDRSGDLKAYRRDFEVQPGHQGKGYGKEIMREALAVAQSCGITHVIGEADSPRTVGILRGIMGDEAVVVKDFAQEAEQFSANMTPAQAVEYLSGATTQDPNKEGYRSLVLDVDISKLNVRDREPALERDRPAALPVVGRSKEKEKEGRVREQGDESGSSKGKGRELPLHDEFGRAVNQGKASGTPGREVAERELGGFALGNTTQPTGSNQSGGDRVKEERGIDPHEQARSLAFSSQEAPGQQRVPERAPTTQTPQQTRTIEGREVGSGTQPQGKRQGRLGRFLDNVREHVPGMQGSRTKENTARIAEIANTSAQTRKANEARERDLERGLQDRGVSQQAINAWREQHGSLVGAVNHANYTRTVAELERARVERSQTPGVQQKGREVADAQAGAQAAHVREATEEAKTKARSVADSVNKSRQPRVKGEEGREIDLLTRLIESNRASEAQPPVRAVGEDTHTQVRGREPENKGQSREVGDTAAAPAISEDVEKTLELHRMQVRSAEEARQRAALAREAERKRLEALGKSSREVERALDAWDAARRAEAPKVTKAARGIEARGIERTRDIR